MVVLKFSFLSRVSVTALSLLLLSTLTFVSTVSLFPGVILLNSCGACSGIKLLVLHCVPPLWMFGIRVLDVVPMFINPKVGGVLIASLFSGLKGVVRPSRLIHWCYICNLRLCNTSWT